MRILQLFSLAVLGAICARADLIDFDGTGAPTAFSQTTALRDLYAGQGVNFLGTTGANDGGAILNQNSNFGVGALSGTDFLAFNPTAGMSDGGIPQLNEIINFDLAQSFVSIFLSGADNNDFMRLEAFAGLNGTGGSLGFDQHTAPAGDWSQFMVSVVGIRSVIISGPDANGLFVADDLSFSTTPGVPEPGSWLLMSGGLAALGFLRRRVRP
jgi:PEP-CTERM motif